MANLPHPIDMTLLQHVTRGHPEKIRQLLSVYLKQNDQTLQGLKEAIESSDMEKILQKAHAMAGASVFLGAIELSVPLFELERMGKSGRLTPKSRDLITLVEKEFARVHSFFNTL